MAGQLWLTPSEGGYLYSPELSRILRKSLQPATKFRQFCKIEDAKGLHAGDKFYWNNVGNVGTQGGKLSETNPIPETGFTVSQSNLTLYEYGNSTPYTLKLDIFAKQDVVSIIDSLLKDDARKAFDIEAFTQFKATPLRVAPTSGTSTTAVTLTTNSATATTNNVELGTGHVKAISDLMKERNIPAFSGDDYFCISHPTTYRTFMNSLESIRQYTDIGMNQIMSGEKGRYENTRFVEQTFIPKGGANDSTTFDPATGTADAWNNNKSSWAFFFGGDVVIEAPVIPEEIRAKIPGDYGRSRGIAWYAVTGFGLANDAAANARVVMWDSAA